MCLLLFFSSHILCAQAPQRFTYQAVIRNASNGVLANQPVRLRISVLYNSGYGDSAVYVETHIATTTINGQVNLEVGGGTVVSGSLSGIYWTSGAYFIKTEVDPSGGSNYTLVSTSRLQSVPYAMYSVNSGNGVRNGTVKNQLLYWNGNSWDMINPGANGQVLTLCDGVLTWTTGGQCPGFIDSLNCRSATVMGTLTQGVSVNGVSVIIPYFRGNGGYHNGQSVSSTGVSGLIASLPAGIFANGSGNITYTISGTPSSAGTANFSILIGGRSCNLSLTVN